MEWIPTSAWLSKVRVDAAAIQLNYDLAVDASGRSPSRVAAGLERPFSPVTPAQVPNQTAVLLGIATIGLGAILLLRSGARAVAR